MRVNSQYSSYSSQSLEENYEILMAIVGHCNIEETERRQTLMIFISSYKS